MRSGTTCRKHGRNAGVAGAIQQSSTLPTEDQMWQVDRAWEVMEALVGPLNELITSRVPALNARLYAEGVRPKPGEVVRVPGGRPRSCRERTFADELSRSAGDRSVGSLDPLARPA